jgi:hypothetical protein
MSWHKISLSSAELVSWKHQQLQNAFEDLFRETLAPKDAGMFKSTQQGQNDYLFSPAASRIAQTLIDSYGGTECPAPRRSQVKLLVGHNGADEVSSAPEGESDLPR